MSKFAELLKDYIHASGISVSQLARQAGLPRRTIANWLEGYAQKPREWRDVIMIATALHLDRLATDDLLVSANFPALGTLRTHYPDHILLRSWNEPADNIGQHIVAIIGESDGTLFQGLPFQKAVYLMEQTVRLAEQLGDRRYLCQLTLELAYCLNALGRYDAAIAAVHKVIALAEHANQSEVILEARALLLRILVYSGQDRSEMDRQRRQLQIALQAEYPLSQQLQTRVIYSLGLWASSIQRLDEATYYYQQIVQSPEYRLTVLNNLSDLAIRQQDYDQAQQMLNQVIDLTAQTPDHPILSYIYVNLGVTHMRCGDYTLATQAFDTGLTIASGLEDARAIFFTRLSQGELALYRSDYMRADTEFRAVLRLCNEESFNETKPFLEYCINRLEKGQGRFLLNDPYYKKSIEDMG